MLKLLTRSIALTLSAFAIVLAIAWQATAHTNINGGSNGDITDAAVIATAPSPPALQPAILNGKPIQVLYITRSEDTVLVRCYPGYEPTLAVQAMSGNPDGGGQQQGILTCISSDS